MPDKKLTDNEIIKALECCSTYKGKCTNCPAFVKVDRSNCKQVLLGAIDLINRLQAKNKNLQERNVILRGLVDTQKAENERLTNCRKEEVEKLMAATDKVISETKAEAYKEFAERCKECFPSIAGAFECFLKEFLEGRESS